MCLTQLKPDKQQRWDELKLHLSNLLESSIYSPKYYTQISVSYVYIMQQNQYRGKAEMKKIKYLKLMFYLTFFRSLIKWHI